MRAKRFEQVLERARGVSDRVERRQRALDAERLGTDSNEGLSDKGILIGKDGTKV